MSFVYENIEENKVMSLVLTVREMKAEAEITGMLPKKESAKMAATTGNMPMQPLTILEI